LIFPHETDYMRGQVARDKIMRVNFEAIHLFVRLHVRGRT